MSTFSDVRTPKKGILVVPERDNLVIQFQFNPADFSESHETIYPKHAVPGASHPVYQYGAGGERLISFTLYFDADIGYRNTATRRRYTENGFLSLNPLLNTIRSLTYPIVKAGSGVKQVYSPIAYLDGVSELMGTQSIECIVKKADPKVTFYSPDLRPLKAQVTMELAQVVSRRVTADLIAQGRYY